MASKRDLTMKALGAELMGVGHIEGGREDRGKQSKHTQSKIAGL